MTHPGLDLSSALTSSLADTIGWTLVHFLWQGLLLAVLLQAILPLCRSAVARHNWTLGTLAAMCAAPVATFLWLREIGSGAVTLVAGTLPQGVKIAEDGFAPGPIPLSWTGWVVGLWLAGMVLLSLRALGGLVLAQRLRRGGFALPNDVLQRCRALQRRLAPSWPVTFLQTRQVTVPMVVGWLRPVILLPVAALAGLSPQQLDSLILHELAHIRRLDAFVNVMLMLAETVLFYHPAIWWVTRRVRTLREHCCDDIAVAHCGDAAVYVEALTALETGRSTPAFALAAGGSLLKDRVVRLLGAPSQTMRFSPAAMAGVVFLGLLAATMAMAQIGKPAGAADFTIRVVDESVPGNVLQGPAGEDRVPLAHPGKDMPPALWLKREGAIAGDGLAEAQAGSNSRGAPLINFRLTAKGQAQFAALTKANVGHPLAVVVNGAVISTPKVIEPILGGTGVLSGDFKTVAEAKAVADEIMGRSVRPQSKHAAVSPLEVAENNFQKPVIISADKVVNDPIGRFITYSGHAVFVQGNLHIGANSIRADILGGNTINVTAEGDVVVTGPLGTVHGGRAVVDEVAQTVSILAGLVAPASDTRQGAISNAGRKRTATLLQPSEQLQQLAQQKAASELSQDAITDDELNQRVALVEATSGNETPTEAQREAIRAKVREQLETEKAQFEEAQRQHITVSTAEIESKVQKILADNNMTEAQLDQVLARGGASVTALRMQLGAQVAWQKTVDAAFAAQHPGHAAADPTEIARFAELERMKAVLARQKDELARAKDELAHAEDELAHRRDEMQKAAGPSAGR